MSIFLDVPSPFDLPAPSDEWCRAIEQYDPDLRIFRSLKHPVYRLARVARNSAGLTAGFFEKIPNLNPDTVFCIQKGLVAVPLTLHTAALAGSPHLIVDRLMRRDVWRHGGWETVADLLDKQDETRDQQVATERQDALRVRSRAMRTGFQYRTGARVSLVSPVRERFPDPEPSVAAPDPTTGP